MRNSDLQPSYSTIILLQTNIAAIHVTFRVRIGQDSPVRDSKDHGEQTMKNRFVIIKY